MLRLVADENFNDDVLRGLLQLEPRLDVVRVRDCNLEGATDPELLEWASRESRIIISHDRRTLAPFAYERVRLGLSVYGVFIVDDWMPIAGAIGDLFIAPCCSNDGEWMDQVLYIPL